MAVSREESVTDQLRVTFQFSLESPMPTSPLLPPFPLFSSHSIQLSVDHIEDESTEKLSESPRS